MQDINLDNKTNSRVRNVLINTDQSQVQTRAKKWTFTKMMVLLV